MKTKSLFTIIILILMVSPNLWAGDDLSKVDSEALAKTQKLLKSKSARQQYIERNKKAQKTDDLVNQVAGTGANKEELYRIASEIFGSLAKQEGGKVENMADVLKKASENPEVFFRGLSSEQQQQIQKLTSELEKTSPAPSK